MAEFSQIPPSPNNFHFFLTLLPRKNHWMKPHLFCSMQYLTKLVDLLLQRSWRRQLISCITHQPFIILSCALRQNGSFTRRFSQSNYRYFLLSSRYDAILELNIDLMIKLIIDLAQNVTTYFNEPNEPCKWIHAIGLANSLPSENQVHLQIHGIWRRKKFY